MKRALSLLCIVTLTLCALGGIILASAADGVTVVVTQFSDYTASWGRDAVQICLDLSADFTDAEQYAYISADFEDYITVNGVLAKERRADPTLYEIHPDYSYPDAVLSVQPDADKSVMILTMQGGGLCFPKPDAVCAITLDAEMPMKDGTLGRDITLVYDPATQTWAEGDAPAFDVPGASDTEPVEPGAPLDASITTATMHDFSEARGFAAGYFFQLDITLSEPFTSEPQWSVFTDAVVPYVELNGVSLKDRYERPDDYHVVTTDAGFYGGQSVVVQNAASNVVTVLIIGGGDGAPDLEAENTLTLKAGFPLENGVLKEDVTIMWDPAKQAWEQVNNGNEGDEGDSTGGVLVLDDQWTRNEQNLITNFYSMYQPEVVYIPEWDNGEDYPYLMYFFGWANNQENAGYPGGDAIFMAHAKALEGPWEVYSYNRKTKEYFWDAKQRPQTWYPIIVCGDVWYDSWHVGDPSVEYIDGTFYMAMSSMGTDEDGIPMHLAGDTDGNACCILGATSTDGIHWTKSAEPLLVWEGERGYNETAEGAKEAWGGGHQRPSILFEDGKWKMWFDWKENQYGYAECEPGVENFMDGSKWTEIYGPDNPYPNAPYNYMVDLDVIKVGDTYYGYADPFIYWYGIYDDALPVYPEIPEDYWAQRQIVEFQSKNGIDWEVTGYFRPDAGYDANQIPQAFFDEKNNRLCIFYATQRGVQHGEWPGAYDWRWDNIRMMYKSLGPVPEPPATEPSTEPPVTDTAAPPPGTATEGPASEGPASEGPTSGEATAGEPSESGCTGTLGLGATVVAATAVADAAYVRRKKED